MMPPLLIGARPPYIPPRNHSDAPMNLAHWPDAVIILVLGVALFFAADRFDSRVRHLDEKDDWSVKRLRGNPPVELGLLLSPQAAVLTAIAALLERGILTPQGSGFVPAGSLAKPQNTLESAVLARLTQAHGQGVSVEHLLADPGIVSALDEVRSSARDKHLVRSMSTRAEGLITVAGLALFYAVAFGLITWHGWGGGMPVALIPTGLCTLPLLFCIVDSFQTSAWLAPGVQSALRDMRFEYRQGSLAHSTRGGGYRETGVSLFGAVAFERFWPRQSVTLQLEPEDVDSSFDIGPFTAPKKPWPDGT